MKRPAVGLRVGIRVLWPEEGTVYGTVIEHLSSQFTLLTEDEEVRIYFYRDDWFNAEEAL